MLKYRRNYNDNTAFKTTYVNVCTSVMKKKKKMMKFFTSKEAHVGYSGQSKVGELFCRK